MVAKLFTKPFGVAGDKTPIPNGTQVDGTVSYETGFGADYERQLGVDPAAKNIDRQSFNELMFDATTSLQEMQAGFGTSPYSLTLAQSLPGGGYPKGALIPKLTGDGFWLCTVAANTSNPDAGGAGWAQLVPQATESVVGVAKVATTPIATAGTNDTDMMTPLKTKLAIAAQASSPVQATESVAGIAKIATQALTNAGVDDTTIVTPKKLFAAQQAALNLKMNLTGDGATPRLGTVSVDTNGLNLNQQGAYLSWNEYGDGKTSLVNNQGIGSGGFLFRNVNKDNTVETGRVTIDGSGSLSSTGTIRSAGEIYGANGAVTVETNGDILGSVWGGWLSIYIANLLNTARINVASAATVNLTTSAPGTRNIAITGATNIAGVTVAAGRLYFVTFLGALTLINSATLVTQGGANITTTPGDTCILRATAANTVEILCYTRGIPQAIGDGQTTQNMVGQRVVATSYTNTTGRPILLSVYTVPVAANILNLFVNDVVVAQNTINNAASGANSTLTWVILPGQVYRVTTTYGALAMWTEITV